ncbi:MAG: amino acid adenylation domain-containing protein [Ignavibacteria bacterium]|nr:amino acid adenylation domain-containing protein [Ignavibacteria bacterium]
MPILHYGRGNICKGETLEKKISYWKEKLKDVTPLQLPTDHPRPAVQSNRGAVASFNIDKDVTSALKILAQKNESTLFMTTLAALKVLLFRYSNQADICVGTGTAGRNQYELEGLIGFFINTLALRTELKPDSSFSELLKQVRQTTLDAFDHQEIPFEKIVESVVKKRDMSRNPVFQVMFVLQNTPDIPVLNLGEIQFIRESHDHTTALFDLSFSLNETSKGLAGSVEFNTDLFTEHTVERMLEHFKILLSSIVQNPDHEIINLRMISKAEEDKLLIDFNNNDTEYPDDKTIIELFEAQAEKTPNAVALVFEDQELTYNELNERSNQLAHYLKSKGVKEETFVSLCIERSPDMIIAILGILKAGGVYVPIDPEYPEERIRFMIEDTGSNIILSSSFVKSKLSVLNNSETILLDEDRADIGQMKKENPQTYVKPDNLAYVIYTSGSTGRPKGVTVTQKNVVSLVKGIDYVTLTKDDKLLSTGSSSFDATTFEYWGMLLNGGQLVLCTEKILLEIDQLKEEIIKRKINRMWFTSSWFNQLLETDITLFSGLETILVGGEKLSEYHIQKLRQAYPGMEIINGYGPTENTTFSLTYRITDKKIDGSIPIGYPLNNRKAYILDEREQIVPIGVPGEICLSGAGLSRGYLNRPDQTEERFINNPFSKESGTRMYKTGDLGRWLSDGSIEYLGRKDEQVKIRGYRIELGEIENVLQESGMISQAAVVVHENEAGDKTLVCYVIPLDSFDKSSVISYLRGRLPEYMIPSLWVEAEHFVLTPNGKINKKVLPSVAEAEQISNKYIAPRNEFEEKLAVIWQDILHIEKAGIEDDFFESGGHSLLAMRLISAIRKELKLEIAVKELFSNPTIGELAQVLQEQMNNQLLPSIESVQDRPKYVPLSFSQERLWFIDQLEGSLVYNLPSIIRFKGKINTEALTYSLREIISRHEVLRTVILQEDGSPYQHIKSTDEWKLGITDGTVFKDDAQLLKDYIQQLINIPFDLSKDYMLRAELITLKEDESILVVTMHHIASDAWSMPIIVKEVTELYRSYEEGNPLSLTPLKLQYADFAIWQRNYLQGEVLDKKLDYWKKKLDGVSVLHLPSDLMRSSVKTNSGTTQSFKVEKETADGLNELSRQQGSTLFMTLLSAFNVLLYRYSGQSDISVGTSITNRPQQEIENLIGFFVNTLALRSEVSNDITFKEFIQQVKQTTLDAYSHQEVPFEKVVDAVVKDRDPGRSPLFQVMLVLHNTPEVPQLQLGGVRMSTEAFENNVSKFEITFFVNETPNGLMVSVQYRSDLYSERMISRMTEHFKELLRSVIKDPDQKIGLLPMLSKEEEHQLSAEINTSAVIYPKDKSIVDLFEDQVKKTPSRSCSCF